MRSTPTPSGANPFHPLSAASSGDGVRSDRIFTLDERIFAPPAQGIEVPDPESAIRTMFLRRRTGSGEPVHPAPIRQNRVVLAGAGRVTASDLALAAVWHGSVWRGSVTTGLGHHTRVIGDAGLNALVVELG